MRWGNGGESGLHTVGAGVVRAWASMGSCSNGSKCGLVRLGAEIVWAGSRSGCFGVSRADRAPL